MPKAKAKILIGDATTAKKGKLKLANLLGGTADLPDVLGLLETGGAKLLTGAIGDGQFLKRVGTDLVGVAAPGGAGDFTRVSNTQTTVDNSTSTQTLGSHTFLAGELSVGDQLIITSVYKLTSNTVGAKGFRHRTAVNGTRIVDTLGTAQVSFSNINSVRFWAYLDIVSATLIRCFSEMTLTTQLGGAGSVLSEPEATQSIFQDNQRGTNELVIPDISANANSIDNLWFWSVLPGQANSLFAPNHSIIHIT